MRILYAIQGTGNGHVSRAREIVPILKEFGNVDVLVSGTQAEVQLPFKIDYKFRGLSFVFGKNGGVDLYRTFNELVRSRLRKEMLQLAIKDYNLVLNDFEPVSAWACYFSKTECIGLSHQAGAACPSAPKPKVFQPFGKFLLYQYAPVTCAYGFHFERYAENIYTPVIRSEIRNLVPGSKNFYTVYLPAYSDEKLVDYLSQFNGAEWKVFSKHNKKPFKVKNVDIQPVDNEAFIQSMAAGKGVFCGAGFETPAEALYLKKKVMVIPMTNQYEQHCNAASIANLGVPVIFGLNARYKTTIEKWLSNNDVVKVDYPDITKDILAKIIEKHARK